MDGIDPIANTRLGRFHVSERPEAFARLHLHDGSKLRCVDHEPKVAVLDQEDLHKQGIVCSQFIPGAGDPDALGSCTANTMVEALSNILGDATFAATVHSLGQVMPAPGQTYTDTVAAERAAIGCYHAVTDQTGQPSTEWPPTDCGSSGPFLYEWTLAQKLIGSEKIAAHDAESIVSLMQQDGALLGMPWCNAWFQPNTAGFIDGNGTAEDLRYAVRSGVAGGHEVYLSAVEKLKLTLTGRVIPEKTVLRFRNHWTASWADHGSGHVHLSTLLMLGGATDIRRFVGAK